ncbi:diacylglycerol kinase [Brochothrix campestris FSL F6-1037]|uniref:Diacylglycerol kinase n=1 Tax=Brochothrix campestris FSL F6-1037 TaxID=1265861 RepID=W7D0X6_9LIST|nr:diacylglycerol kinase [Brochothrix campestris FSL F6-1037]
MTQTEWLFLVLAVAFVIFAEMVNTACERIVDLCTGEYNELAKHAKDIAAGAVLIATIGAVIIGAIIFMPYLLAFFIK